MGTVFCGKHFAGLQLFNDNPEFIKGQTAFFGEFQVFLESALKVQIKHLFELGLECCTGGAFGVFSGTRISERAARDSIRTAHLERQPFAQYHLMQEHIDRISSCQPQRAQNSLDRPLDGGLYAGIDDIAFRNDLHSLSSIIVYHLSHKVKRRSSLLTLSNTLSQSPGSGWRKSRMEGYHGLSSRFNR